MKGKRNIERKKFFLAVALSVLYLNAWGQITINEFSAANSTIIADPEFNDYSDWIELRNLGTEEQNLKGYYLSDNLDTPGKWQLGNDVIIAPGAYILIWADGTNTGIHTNFKLSSLGEEIGLYSPSGELLDSVSFTEQKTDVSYGRLSGSDHLWAYFDQPTPNASNSSRPYVDFTSLLPEFSKKGGFYSSSFSVELSSAQGGLIRYTLDGSVPDENSTIYSTAIGVASTTIIRARIYEEDKIPGPPLTHSYFINENSIGGKLPVVSIATEPENFWDPDKGIYVQSFKPLWEIPINIELFENDGSDRAAFNELAGSKVNGLYSWKLPQKMLGIYFKKKFGKGSLDYPITHQRKRSSYKSFALRASGSDWSLSLIRDMLAQHTTELNMDIDIMGYRPAIVYVNGEYLGIHNIREKVDDDYIEKSYQMEPGSFDLVENESYAEAGDLEAYRHLESLLREDLSDAAAYNKVAELVDIENFTDFVITEMATQNISIDHNVMAWKPKESGKWKWILMDVDRGFYAPSREHISFYVNRNVLILRQLLENPSYTSYFGRRLACQLYTSYNPRWIKGLIEGHEKDIEAEIPSHISRWEGTTSSYGNAMPSEAYWRRELGKIKTFADMRPYVLLRDLQSYGFDESANLTLSTYPEDAGVLKLDGLVIPGSTVSAPFLQNLQVELLTEARPGYEFVGWSRPLKRQIVQRGSEWSYLDTGSDPGEDWVGMAYDDGSWSSGPAEFGYGDDDENTVVGFGGDANNKYITTYFRKAFSLLEADLLADHYFLELLKDDGAIVYLNGTEIVRENMIYEDTSLTTSLTTTRESINGEAESAFFFYPIDKSLLLTGENILAVEVHQFEASSTDLSFDLGLFAHTTEGQPIILTDESYPLSIEGDFSLTAVYQADGTCTIPEIVDSDKTLSIECSPYLARGDVTISANATLTIDPGVEIWMPGGASIFVDGVMNALGTSEKPIAIKLNPDEKQGSWGVISFRSTPQKSEWKWVTIEDASTGPDPVRERAAISAFFADLDLDHMTIEEVHGDPITARYSDITLTNSSLHSKVSGDLINVKYGGARIENCHFTGNNQADTDAIDYDEVHKGIIRNSLIQNFKGLNSDAIDIGEQATEISIDSIVVFNITDKGVSVGQQSTVSIQNSVFINCNMGVGVKDSAWVSVDRSLFYNNVDAIAVFEKNLGQAGGNVFVTNSIISNSSHAPYYSDSKSFLELSHSLSDNILLPQQSSNLYGNPRFAEPSFYNFELLPGSPALGSGSLNNEPVDMGVRLATADLQPSVMISQFFIDGDDMGTPEFITLYNPSGSSLDVSGFSVTKGVTASLPEGTVLGPRSSLYLSNNATAEMWDNFFYPVFQWELGKLSNDGESIQLEDNHGIVLDYLVYDKNALWPADGFIGHGLFKLISPGLDNHFPESWEVKQVEELVSSPAVSDPEAFSLFPNPTRAKITIYAPALKNQKVEIFNLSGHKLDEALLDLRGEASIDLSEYQAGLLLIRVGSRVEKVVLLED